jgi:hypothetical protein
MTNTAVAKARYEEAQTALSGLKRNYPTWNAKAVTFRLKYVADKIAALSPPEAAPAPQPAPTSQASPKPVGKAAALPAGTQLKLIGAGAEPRKPVRFHTKTGDKQSVLVTAKSSMGMGAGDAAPQMMNLPAMKFTVSVLTKDVSGEGDIDYEVIIDDVGVEGAEGVDAQMTQAMKESLKGVKGLHILSTMTDRGVSKKAEPQIPENADAQTRQAMEQIKESFADTELLLPHEPIGPGAKWEIRQKLKTEGMAIDQTSTHTLVSAEGDVLNIKTVITQTASNQKVPNPMMPGTTAQLVKLTGTGNSVTKFDLAKLLPTESTTENHTMTILAMEANGQKQNATMKTDSTIQVESK